MNEHLCRQRELREFNLIVYHFLQQTFSFHNVDVFIEYRSIPLYGNVTENKCFFSVKTTDVLYIFVFFMRIDPYTIPSTR